MSVNASEFRFFSCLGWREKKLISFVQMQWNVRGLSKRVRLKNSFRKMDRKILRKCYFHCRFMVTCILGLAMHKH